MQWRKDIQYDTEIICICYYLSWLMLFLNPLIAALGCRSVFTMYETHNIFSEHLSSENFKAHRINISLVNVWTVVSTSNNPVWHKLNFRIGKFVSIRNLQIMHALRLYSYSIFS